MQLTIFLLISTLLIIKPTINSLFLSDVGIERLPLAFIFVALTAGIITGFYSRFLNKIPLNRIIQFTLIFSVVAISLFSVLLRLNFIDKWILYFFYVWVAVFGVLATSQFWLLANIIFNAREAKRLFSLIGGAAIAGGIFGGYLTSLLAPILGSENLLFVGVIFLILCVPLTRIVWQINPLTDHSPFRRKKRMGKVAEHPLRLIRNSKHLKYLAMITAIGVVVAKIVDYQFSAISSSIITDEDELTAFFGFWFSNFNILSLLIQLFITRKIVGTYGVGISLFFLPAGILIGALGVLVIPGLATAVLIKACDGSLKQSVNKSAIELLALPIPAETKNQAKTFIDVFVDSFATGLSGILLITLISGFNIPVRYISISTILLLLLWIYLVRNVRKEYINLFKKKLKMASRNEQNQVVAIDIENESVYGGILNVLENGTSEQIQFVLDQTDGIQHEKVFTGLVSLLENKPPEITAQAIHQLSDYKSSDLTDKISGFVKNPDMEVKIAAIEYITDISRERNHTLFQSLLTSEDYKEQIAALTALSADLKDNPDLKKIYSFSNLIQDQINQLPLISDENELIFKKSYLLRIIAVGIEKEQFGFIKDSLNDKNPVVLKEAILAAGLSLDVQFLPQLLEFLKNGQFKNHASDAISNYGFKVITYLKNYVNNKNCDIKVLREFPGIIQKIGTQYGVDFLIEFLGREDIKTRENTIESLVFLKSKYPYLLIQNKYITSYIFEEVKIYMDIISALYVQQERIRLSEKSRDEEITLARKNLIQLLEKRLDENLERIFKLLGLKYPPDEMDTVFKELKSDKSEMRANAIELLDNLLDANLKKVLIPIIEIANENITEEILKELKLKKMSQGECFSVLLEGIDLKLKSEVLQLLALLKDKKYLSIAEKYSHHPSEQISKLAQIAVHSINSPGR